MTTIPQKQTAVQLIGPDELTLNLNKEVFQPGPYQILGHVEAVGLCFSDLKLLKQFSKHARKTKINSGIDLEILKEIPSYVPDAEPTVPGHEAVVQIAAVGDKVTDVKVGERYLVQTDYRWIPTDNSNGSFGYNFEGALQEYVLMDERVIIAPNGESMLIPASDDFSAAAIALVEPWACVEDSYVVVERQTIKANGQMLIVADKSPANDVLSKLFAEYGNPGRIFWLGGGDAPANPGIETTSIKSLDEVKDESCDDIIYFGSRAETAEKLFAKVAIHGLLNIVQCGGRFGRDVATMVGRTHYGGIRIIGTAGDNPADAMKTIPSTGEIQPNDKIDVVGAGGPMGVMHVIRNLCQGVEGVTVFAGDLDDGRLANLSSICTELAAKNNLTYRPYNPKKETIDEMFDYIAVMAPIPQLVAAAVKRSGQNARINIFAGIPASVSGNIDLDTYIERGMYFIGTSGSTLDDMKVVLEKVQSHRLDTNLSAGAICGLEGAIDGIRAVEKQQIVGKIICYPACKGLGLTTLDKLQEVRPDVAEKLNDGRWNKEAENVLLGR